ncbi:MAG: FAD binding domain-containing protein [Aestuariivirga sp.]|uniref:FAD binding domain-containing protein n=1 Tax=Aestuariivirga sp. TaxID=2650926 RepID=UPI0038D0EB98
MEYAAPETTKAAVSLLAKAKGSAYVLAGGSDLLVRMRGGFVEPDLVVDIKRIKAMREVKKTASGYTIGAAVSCAELGENKALAKAWPGVVEAANLIGSKQIQGRCTMAGNMCNASPAADSVPALVAAGAKAVIQGPKGKRLVPVEQVAIGPGKTSLKKGELVEALALPARKPRSGDAYLRFIPRTEMDIAVVSAGVNVTIDAKGVITEARVALGAVAPTVLLVAAAAKAIIGTKLDDAALEKLGEAASAACRPIDDKRGTVEFRVKVAAVLAKRAAKIAYKRAGGK